MQLLSLSVRDGEMGVGGVGGRGSGLCRNSLAGVDARKLGHPPSNRGKQMEGGADGKSAARSSRSRA